METPLRVLSLLIYLILGIALAYRWVVSRPISNHKGKRYISSRLYFICCWLGAFILSGVQTKISQIYFDPLDFPGDKGITADVVYDGTGNNAFVLFFGWIFAPIFIGIAKFLKLKLQNKSLHSTASS
jgi:hypothetical protein